MRSSSSAHVEPSPYTPNPVTIIPGPAGVVQLSNSICVEPSSSTPNPVRIIPGPAGLVQRAKLLKENVFILDPDGALMSTQEYMQKVVEDVGEDADFNSGAWVSATNYVNAFGGTVTGCLGDIDNFLKKGKLEQVVAIVKSCSPNALGDLNVTLKDLSGTVPGTIHYKVLDVSSYENDITVGAAMILVNVLVFTPKPSKHYLNITKRNVVEVFREPPGSSYLGTPTCNPNNDPPVLGDCWYNCTSDDITGEDKRHRPFFFARNQALGQTADWFRRALAVERVRGNLRLSGYSACGQDGEGVADADLVLLVTTRPTTGNTLAWAVACERDQWGRAIAGHVNVAPRHLTAEQETLLSATLIHEVMHVLGFDAHAFTHFRDERKRRRSQVTEQAIDEKLGRTVTRVVLPRVVMHSRHHYGTYSENFTGLELEDGGGRGTSGSHWEKRLLMNEIMTGSVDTRSVVSKMTLALLEDSGWYQANYSMADHLDWGRNQGTDFVTAPCNQWKGELICPEFHELCSADPILTSGQCPNSCNSNGDCVDGKCHCFIGFNGHDCNKRSCPSNCSGNGKCLKNGNCECANGFTGIDCSTAVCDEQCSLHGGVCDNGHNCAPSESSILLLLEEVISIQKCEKDGDNRLRVCHSACQAYNLACGASLDCSDQTLFSDEGEGEGEGLCTGWGEMDSWF
ncbi:EGF-like, conserved site-containing protein [Tanacetum coccineum]